MRGFEIDLPQRVLAQHGAVIRGWAVNAIPGSVLPIYLGNPHLGAPCSAPAQRYIENNTAELIAIEFEPGVLLIRAMDRHAHELIEAAESRLREADLSSSAKIVSSDANAGLPPSQPTTRTTMLPTWTGEYGAWAA